jgi:hypothetical protein
MDFISHIQLGQSLLKQQDATSLNKALGHFIIANKMTTYNDIAKPLALYYVAYGNLAIGKIEQAYKIAQKAKRAIPLAQENSVFTNVKIAGEDEILQLISTMESKVPQLKLLANFEDNDLIDNEI